MRNFVSRQGLIGDGRQVHAVLRPEVVPQVEARVDLEQVAAPARGAALEVHLENADQAEAPDDLAAERRQLVVARERQVRAVAGERGARFRSGQDQARDECRGSGTGPAGDLTNRTAVDSESVVSRTGRRFGGS